MPKIQLLEPSIVDAIVAIEKAMDLPKSRKIFWSCALRQICSYLNRPIETVPARWSALNAPIQKLHAAQVGANPKTLSNHKANARTALLWFDGTHDVPAAGVALSPVWAALKQQINDQSRKKKLSGLIRYASAKKIEPKDVTEEVLDNYMRYRAETTALTADNAARRSIARAWNACREEVEGWPDRR
jgi:hypothetical protein